MTRFGADETEAADEAVESPSVKPKNSRDRNAVTNAAR